MGLRFITARPNTVLHRKKGCQMTCDISRRNHTATTVCSSEQVVCHRVARVPSQRNKAPAEGLWIKTFPWFCKSLTCLFPLRLLNGEIYILCPARASPACLSVSPTLFPTQSPNNYRCRGKSSSTEGSVRIPLLDEGFMWKKNQYLYIYLKKYRRNHHYGVKYIAEEAGICN